MPQHPRPCRNRTLRARWLTVIGMVAATLWLPAVAVALPPTGGAAAVSQPTGGAASQPTGGSTTTTVPTSTTSTTAGSRPTTPPTTASPATTAAPPTAPSTTSPPPTVPPAGAPISALQLDQIDSQFLTDVQAEVGSAQNAVDLAEAQQAKAAVADDTATGTLNQERQHLNDLNQGQQRAAQQVVAARNRVKQLAVAAYESGGPGGPMAALLSSESIGDYARREAYFSISAETNAEALARYTKARSDTDRATRVTVDDLSKAEAAKQAADQQLSQAMAAVQQASSVLGDRQALLTLTSDAVSTPNTDIPRMVLDAYQRAAVIVQAQGCQLSWWGLAGIGRVESDHGRAEHAHLMPNGDLVPHIVGVPLTGHDGTALIQDPGGDYAHAEGPMQFIPSTWARWGRDGNADALASPDNIYDAALGAAGYLCATSTALETDAGLEAAYNSYNHSSDYVTEVLAFAHSYEAADLAGLIPPLAPVPLYQLAPAAAQTLSGNSPSTPGTSPAPPPTSPPASAASPPALGTH